MKITRWFYENLSDEEVWNLSIEACKIYEVSI